MKLSFKNIINKIALVGITYYTEDEQLLSQKQIWGKIISANRDEIIIKQNDDTLFHLPADLSAFSPAVPGKYTLRSTGETIENPDFLITWKVYHTL